MDRVLCIILCVILVLNEDVSAKSSSHGRSSKKKEYRPLLMERSAEGRCRNPYPKEMDKAWLVGFIFEAKYTPMASELAYLSMASRFGKSLDSWSDLKKMCMKMSPQVAIGSYQFSAYGRTIYMKCEIKSVGVLKCSEGGENAIFIVVTWTDFKDYLLSTNCHPNGQKSWLVLSTKKKVDSKTKKMIIAHIKDEGFDAEKAKTLSYDSC